MEEATPPGAASENSSNDLEEVKGGRWGCGLTGRPNPQLEGSVTKRIAWLRPLIFLPFQLGPRARSTEAGFLAFGGSPGRKVQKRGPPNAARTPKRLDPPAQSHPESSRGEIDRGRPWGCN